jgi:fermentation-respiration switch protein FrsA (DUF1100 family)
MPESRRRVSTILVAVVLLAVGAYVGFAAHLYFTQDQQIFFPQRRVEITPDQVGLPYDPVTLASSDGVTLHGWYITSAAHPRATVLYLHGNSGNIGNCLETARQLVMLGLNVLVIDYRGYGDSTGTPSEQGMYQDAETAWRYLRDTRHADAQEIVVYGHSLGGAVASWLAAKHTPGALILEAAFTSLPESAADHYPWLPVRWLVRYRFDTLESLRKVHCPVLIIHSVDDQVIAYTHGLRLYEAVTGPKAMLDLHGTHNDAARNNPLEYTHGIDNFLTRYMPP